MSKLGHIIDTLRGFSASKSPVFIGGETGTGKSRIARLVHEFSVRTGPYVEVDCASQTGTLLASALFGHVRGAFTGALTDHKGFFVQADGGTIFLDEIGEMPLEQQPALLRVVQDGRLRPLGARTDICVDVRIVSASHCNLPAEIQVGRFRRDLYGRLVRLPVTIPPLRERADEIPAMAQEIAGRLGLPPPPPSILAALTQPCLWPQNVRDLESIIERAHLLKWTPSQVVAEMRLLGWVSPPTTARPPVDLSSVSIGSGWWTLPDLIARFGLSRRHMQRLIAQQIRDGRLERRGNTSAVRFRACDPVFPQDTNWRDTAQTLDLNGGGP